MSEVDVYEKVMARKGQRCSNCGRSLNMYNKDGRCLRPCQPQPGQTIPSLPKDAETLRMEEYRDAVVSHYGIPQKQLYHAIKSFEVSKPRHTLVFLLYTDARIPVEKITRMLQVGDRSVYHSLHMVRDFASEFTPHIDAIRNMVAQAAT